MWKLTRLSLLQETKSLASHPLWKKSSEFGWLENENEREDKNIYEKTEQVLCSLILYIVSILHTSPSVRFTVDAREFI